MSRLTSVLTMFLAFLAGNAIGLPAELATHSAKVNATNRVALDQVRGSIETNEANNGTVPATVSVGSKGCGCHHDYNPWCIHACGGCGCHGGHCGGCCSSWKC